MTRNTIRRQFRFGIGIAILACGSLFPQQAASAATYKVTSTNDGGSGSLREAITSANNNITNDTIVFELPAPTPAPTGTPIPAGHGRTISLSSALPDLSGNMSIINRGEPVTIQPGTIIRQGEYYIFTITPRSTVLLEGLIITKGAGGVSNRGSLTMRNCTVSQNRDWGGIENVGGSDGSARLTMRDCLLTGNRLVDEVPTSFVYSGGGGALRNFAADGSASASLINCVLQGNSTTHAQIVGPPGGAIANIAFPGGATTLSLSGCILEGNSAGSPRGGGAIYNLTDGETATASVTMVDSTVHDNNASNGGGIMNVPSLPQNGLVTLEKCTFSGNNAANGGAISNGGIFTLTNCTLSENAASSSVNGGGGAIYNFAGTATLTNCTLNANEVTNNATAQSIYNLAGAEVFTGNTLFVRTGKESNFTNDGAFTSRGHNLSNDTAGGGGGTGPGGLLKAAGDLRNTDPRIVALGNNGGPTQTCALLGDSPAIDAGDDAMAPPTDQRGFTRSDVSDIGAYEGKESVPFSLKPGRLGNISTRLGVQTGNNVLIGGFIITGAEPKRVMLRAIGTSLPFENRLQNPTLELFDSSGALIESNDNWVDSSNKQAIIDSTIPPTSDLESAILIDLPADGSAYTAVVRGVDEGTGIGLVEIYDLDSAADSKLANISTRGFVQTGDDVLIAGTIITGQASQRVIIRAMGPSLPLAGKLEDPALELFDANGALLAANDNWRTGGQETEITATGVAPANDWESAIVYRLPSNNASYTATVRGVGETTGIAVVEVYALPPLSPGL